MSHQELIIISFLSLPDGEGSPLLEERAQGDSS
jgi:hypothetical protein